MFGLCEGCSEGGNIDCPLYIFSTEDDFIFISCIVYGLLEMGASILARVDLDFGGGDEENKM